MEDGSVLLLQRHTVNDELPTYPVSKTTPAVSHLFGQAASAAALREYPSQKMPKRLKAQIPLGRWPGLSVAPEAGLPAPCSMYARGETLTRRRVASGVGPTADLAKALRSGPFRDHNRTFRFTYSSLGCHLAGQGCDAQIGDRDYFPTVYPGRGTTIGESRTRCIGMFVCCVGGALGYRLRGAGGIALPGFPSIDACCSRLGRSASRSIFCRTWISALMGGVFLGFTGHV